jgi:CheY-like chemotaxis protein
VKEFEFAVGISNTARASEAAAFIEAIPALSEGAFSDCDVGASGFLVACVVRFRVATLGPVEQRLRFWAHQVGATLRERPAGQPGKTSSWSLTPVRAPLAGCAETVNACAAGDLGRTVGELVAKAYPDAASHDSLAVALDLRQRLDGVIYDLRESTLFVATTVAPPIGDTVPLRLRLLDGSVVREDGVVVATPAAGERGPGDPAGYVLRLAGTSQAAIEAFERRSGPPDPIPKRRAPRHPFWARARLVESSDPSAHAALASTRTWNGPGELAKDNLENISQGGSFVRTSTRLPLGTPVVLDFEVSPGRWLTAPAMLVYANDRGVGVQFKLNAAGDAAIHEVIDRITSQRRHVLVVDDDRLTRDMLGDELTQRGFEVFMSADGLQALQLVSEELLSLDLLVTDLVMPVMDGGDLIRKIRTAGGETDLAIVVMTGEVTPELEKLLTALGADAVLKKGLGATLIAAAAEDTIRTRAAQREA